MRVRQEVPGLARARLARHWPVELSVDLGLASVRRGGHGIHVPSAFRVQRVDFSALLHDWIANVSAHVSLCLAVLLCQAERAIRVDPANPRFLVGQPVPAFVARPVGSRAPVIMVPSGCSVRRATVRPALSRMYSVSPRRDTCWFGSKRAFCGLRAPVSAKYDSPSAVTVPSLRTST